MSISGSCYTVLIPRLASTAFSSLPNDWILVEIIRGVWGTLSRVLCLVSVRRGSSSSSSIVGALCRQSDRSTSSKMLAWGLCLHTIHPYEFCRWCCSVCAGYVLEPLVIAISACINWTVVRIDNRESMSAYIIWRRVGVDLLNCFEMCCRNWGQVWVLINGFIVHLHCMGWFESNWMCQSY